MTKILVADDHPLVRAGLRRMLEEDANLGQVGEAAGGTEALAMLASSSWDLLILDINMPDQSGLDVLREARLRHPATKVLVVSGFAERQYAISVMRAGAQGYLAKDCAPQDLLKAVRCILQGRRYLTPTVGELLMSDLDSGNDDKPLHTRLSEREMQIFSKIAVGVSVSEIANEYGLSVKTISTYRTRILEKMNFATNADITTYAVRNQLTSQAMPAQQA